MEQFGYEALGVVGAFLALLLGWNYLITTNRRKCPRCKGSGDYPPGRAMTRPCKRCGGSGKVMTWFVRVVRNFSQKAREKSEGLRK